MSERDITAREWIAYLKESGSYETYEGTCDCFQCRDIRAGFNRWKERRAAMTPTPNPQPPLVISEEADNAWVAMMGHSSRHEQLKVLQQLINQATEKLTKLVELENKAKWELSEKVEKLIKENEEIGMMLAETATEAQNYKIEWNCCKDEIQILTTRIKELEAEVEALKPI